MNENENEDIWEYGNLGITLIAPECGTDCYALWEQQQKSIQTDKDLLKILTRYEGCVSRCERDGDDSDEAVKELAESRETLLSVLRQAKIQLENI